MRHPNDNVTLLRASNGLVIAHRLNKMAAVDYCGVVVRAGSRDDPADLPGLAHFVEHTIFKGTQKRSSWHIINRMERVGGELNAYTTKEETVVYTAAPRGYLMRSFDLIADLIISSRFPDNQLDREREVVADEISSYLDTPADAVFDDFEDLIFASTPLGHNILGNESALARMHSQQCRDYLRNWYTVGNLVVFYYGPLSPDRVLAFAEKCFNQLPDHNCHHEPMPDHFSAPVFDVVRNIDSHQAHTVMGALTVDMYDKRRYAVSLLTNILGGPGMNSRLNVALREKRGLVYSVEAATGLMSECGLFTIYFGCDPYDTDKCCTIVRQQIDEISNNTMTEMALNQAKRQYLGQLAVASDSRENLAISTGRRTLFFGDSASSDAMIDHINAITPQDIAEAAQSISNLSRLTLL